ncbi:MAG: serine/threonine-protein phosphatase [Mojavia pulchra JT2-VF2]|jgi:protein phosphatase|uniref:Serine/threonine-protein phosphatase n=1 Tax=Mojavia pulchra JT2-VF2 TaxID=287848 RepID=A0A951PVS7_9NOST|nr:serine/threonine-protein phosphatase [Mojavia pulchra JT2-VF2]
MENDVATLYCPNEMCQALNPLTHKFCLRCSTPLPKHYLWAEGDGLSVATPGEILDERYLVINKSVVLDTKPGLVPQTPELDNSSAIRAYLRLIPYRLHVPQVYGVIPVTDGRSRKDILLLEKPPILTDGTALQVQLCSELISAWRDATSMRQLNWLWQLAHLWHPFASEGVASSLLDPYLLRVEGSLVRLLELRVDSSTTPGLPQLGEFWQQLHREAKPAIAELINKISNALIQQQINSPDQLITVLDQGLAQLGRSQKSTIKIFTKTDTGPSRQRNEDACYPPSGTLVSKPPQATALAIVCDGIGGHEGGNVASNLAIETIQHQVHELTKVPYDHIDPSLLLNDLESAVAVVNDKISQRNDGENRQGRQRMGTTLVMALPIAHEMYITHVGDSRAYWITRHGCYQVTLDDDVASREVRLGYAVYREAILQGGSGSLVQALGMSPSTSLHPTAQRFILDEDAVFLLTSDGLSDFDRVEDYWETEVLPILTGETDVAHATEKLVEIANTKNGHDNVTIALVHCQVRYSEPNSSLAAVIPDSFLGKATNAPSRTVQGTLLGNPNQKTQVIPETKPAKTAQLPLNFIVPLILVLAAGYLGYLVMQMRSPSGETPVVTSPTATPQPTTTEATAPRTIDNLDSGWVIQTQAPIRLNNQELLPSGSLLQVIDKKPNPKAGSRDFFVQLRLCPQDTPAQSSVNKPDNSNSSQQVEKLAPIQFSQSQLKKYKVNVLSAKQPSACDDVSPSLDNQTPVPNPQSDTSPTKSNTP